MDASHVYVRALALGCFYSHISTRTFRRALTASLDRCAEIKSAPSVGRVWRNVPESGARSVGSNVTHQTDRKTILITCLSPVGKGLSGNNLGWTLKWRVVSRKTIAKQNLFLALGKTKQNLFLALGKTKQNLFLALRKTKQNKQTNKKGEEKKKG